MIPYFLRSVLRHQGEALPTLGMADYETQAESFDEDRPAPGTSEGAAELRWQLGTEQFNRPH